MSIVHRPHFRKWLEQFTTAENKFGALARAALNDDDWLNAGYNGKTLGFDPNVLGFIMKQKGASREEMKTLDEMKDMYLQNFTSTYLV